MKKIEHIPVNVTTGSVDVRERLRAMDRSQPHAVLATISENSPYTSLVAYCLTPDLKGIVFATPRNTRKYRNILMNHNVSFLIDTRSHTANAYLRSEAVTVTGSAKPVRRSRKRDELAELLIEKHPALREFINASSTVIVLVETAAYMHVGGFQETTEWVPGV